MKKGERILLKGIGASPGKYKGCENNFKFRGKLTTEMFWYP
jgi:hypothetical protein